MRCDATTTANKANGTRLIAPRLFNRPSGRGKELNPYPAPQISPDSVILRPSIDSYYAGSV